MFNVNYLTSSYMWLYPYASTHCVLLGNIFTMPFLTPVRVSHLAVMPGFNQLPVAPPVAVTILGVIFIVPIGFFHGNFILLLGCPLLGLYVFQIILYSGHLIGNGGDGIILHLDGLFDNEDAIFSHCGILHHVEQIIIILIHLDILHVVYYATDAPLLLFMMMSAFHPYLMSKNCACNLSYVLTAAGFSSYFSQYFVRMLVENTTVYMAGSIKFLFLMGHCTSC